jgi:GTPase SAR1 family protein
MKKLSVILLGNINVGKTRLCHLLTDDYIKDKYKSTTVVDYFTFREDNNIISLWDTGNCIFVNENQTSFMKYCKIVLFVCNNEMRSIKYIENYINNNKQLLADKECMLVYFGNHYSEDMFEDFMKNNFLKIFKITEIEKDIEKLKKYLLNYCEKICHDDNPSILPGEDIMKPGCCCCKVIFSLMKKMNK